MSILRKILRVEKPQPVTQEELEQLKMQIEKEKLNAEIAKIKNEQSKYRKEKWANIASAWSLGKPSGNPFETSKAESFI